MANGKFTAEQVAQALTDVKGMAYLAAKRLGCSPATVYNYINKYATVRDAKEAAEGEILDLAELKVVQAVQNGEPWAIQFVLKTKGKGRGYTERTEVTGEDGKHITIDVVFQSGAANGKVQSNPTRAT